MNIKIYFFITLSNFCLHLSTDSIVKTSENFTVGEKRSTFKRFGSVNLCTLCDTSKKDVICVSEEMKLQAITLKGGHCERKGRRGTSLQLENTFTQVLYCGTILSYLHLTSGFLFYDTLNWYRVKWRNYSYWFSKSDLNSFLACFCDVRTVGKKKFSQYHLSQSLRLINDHLCFVVFFPTLVNFRLSKYIDTCQSEGQPVVLSITNNLHISCSMKDGRPVLNLEVGRKSLSRLLTWFKGMFFKTSIKIITKYCKILITWNLYRLFFSS